MDSLNRILPKKGRIVGQDDRILVTEVHGHLLNIQQTLHRMAAGYNLLGENIVKWPLLMILNTYRKYYNLGSMHLAQEWNQHIYTDYFIIKIHFQSIEMID